MRLRAKAVTLALATVATVGVVAAPANADVHRGKARSKAYCGSGSSKRVSWMYTDQDHAKNFYFNNHCGKATHIRIRFGHFNGTFVNPKYKCFNLKKGENNKKPKVVNFDDGDYSVYKVYLVKHC